MFLASSLFVLLVNPALKFSTVSHPAASQPLTAHLHPTLHMYSCACWRRLWAPFVDTPALARLQLVITGFLLMGENVEKKADNLF
jgi:hypothetical protein